MIFCIDTRVVSTHSRLKAAADDFNFARPANPVSTHSRLKAAGGADSMSLPKTMFQHTAA